MAWELFNNVEDEGGFLALLKEGKVQKAVNESGVKRHTDVARRKEVLLGTNQYPNFNETALGKIESGECSCGCGCGSGEVVDGAVDYLIFDRAASQFEQLRLDTERSGKRPKVFMLTIGNLAMRLARAQFSSNFFGCAGYEIIDNIGFNTVKEGIDAAIEKKPTWSFFAQATTNMPNLLRRPTICSMVAPCLLWPVPRMHGRIEGKGDRRFHPCQSERTRYPCQV